MIDPFTFGYPSRQLVVRGRRFGVSVLTIGGAVVINADGAAYGIRSI